MSRDFATADSLIFYPDVDRYNHIKPSAILRNFQQIGSVHVADSGRTVEQILAETNKAYFVLRFCAEILTPLSVGPIQLRTWVEDCQRLFMTRAYEIYQNGQLAVRGYGCWIMLDLASKLPVRNPWNYCQLPIKPLDPNNPVNVPEVFLPTELTQTNSLPVLECFCDINRHINNGFYPDFCLEATQGAEITKFCIVYRREAGVGETITLHQAKVGDKIYIRGMLDSKTINFEAELTVRQ